MRQLANSTRAPRAIGLQVHGRKSFDAALKGYGAKQPAKPRTKADREAIALLRQQAKEREQRRWSFESGMSKLSVVSFTNELIAIKHQATLMAMNKPCLPEQLEDLRGTSKALGQFVRHFFGSDMSLRHFCEWMYESPDLHDGTVSGLSKSMRGLPFSQLSHRQQSSIRARLRLYLYVIFKNCLMEEFLKKFGKGNGNRLELRVVNPITRTHCCAIIDLNGHKIIAFYLEKEMNRKRSHRTARQLDHRLRRLH